MGYTHYWTSKKTTDEQFDKFVKNAKILKKNLPKYSESAGSYYGKESNNKRVLKIRGGLGEGKGEFNNERIWFNGDEKRGLDHETFMIERNPDGTWEFCKTARKPYDLLVGACLLAAQEFLGYEISSDGDVEDWVEIAKYYNDIVNTSNPFTLKMLIKLFGDYQDNYQKEHPELELEELL